MLNKVCVNYICSWTVIVRRFDGSGDYNRSWAEYKSGFGDVSGEAWLGNEYLHYLTNNRFVYIVLLTGLLKIYECMADPQLSCSCLF